MSKDKHKKIAKKKTGKKESQLAIRVSKSERDDFVELCDRLDTSAAREIRRFMRDFVTSHRARPEAVTPVPTAELEPSPEPDPIDPPAATKPRRASPRAPKGGTAASPAKPATTV